ncbi:hypothetical protein FDECE_11574 [Fusarium decemcellulare]|nr:hypothetical protein FDECE_11574 [Fusarium decemcellulare]
MDPSKNSQHPTEREKLARHLYGTPPRVPRSPTLLHQQLEVLTCSRISQVAGSQANLAINCQGRKYFDSGDFALAQAHGSSNMGSVTTGIHHPLRSGISHPSAPVPSSSNVRDGANQDFRGERRSSEMKSDSHLKEEVASQFGDDPEESKEARE